MGIWVEGRFGLNSWKNKGKVIKRVRVYNERVYKNKRI
jgi:hypothetical protein